MLKVAHYPDFGRLDQAQNIGSDESAAPAEAARGERSPSLKRITYYADTQTITEQRKLGEFLVTPERGRFGISRKYGLTNPLARHNSSTSA